MTQSEIKLANVEQAVAVVPFETVSQDLVDSKTGVFLCLTTKHKHGLDEPLPKMATLGSDIWSEGSD
jgi:hypothetical protein